jgi:hypothetical protein
MTDKYPMQADGSEAQAERDDGVSTAKTHGRERGGGESSGGAYPDGRAPGEAEHDVATFSGHGGQSEIAYHGPDNPNATTDDD